MWEAHSVLMGAIIAYTSKMRPKEPGCQIKNDLLQIPGARGNEKFTYRMKIRFSQSIGDSFRLFGITQVCNGLSIFVVGIPIFVNDSNQRLRTFGISMHE